MGDRPSRLGQDKAGLAPGTDWPKPYEQLADEDGEKPARPVDRAPQPVAPSISPVQIAFLLNSALYLSLIVWVGLFWGNKPAVLLAIASVGIATLGYATQAMFPKHLTLASVLVAASYVPGVLAGLVLLVR